MSLWQVFGGAHSLVQAQSVRQFTLQTGAASHSFIS
jgi:hypothetical protein